MFLKRAPSTRARADEAGAPPPYPKAWRMRVAFCLPSQHLSRKNGTHSSLFWCTHPPSICVLLVTLLYICLLHVTCPATSHPDTPETARAPASQNTANQLLSMPSTALLMLTARPGVITALAPRSSVNTSACHLLCTCRTSIHMPSSCHLSVHLAAADAQHHSAHNSTARRNNGTHSSLFRKHIRLPFALYLSHLFTSVSNIKNELLSLKYPMHVLLRAVGRMATTDARWATIGGAWRATHDGGDDYNENEF